MKPHQTRIPFCMLPQPSGARSSCSDGEQKWPQPPATSGDNTEIARKFGDIEMSCLAMTIANPDTSSSPFVRFHDVP